MCWGLGTEFAFMFRQGQVLILFCSGYLDLVRPKEQSCPVEGGTPWVCDKRVQLDEKPYLATSIVKEGSMQRAAPETRDCPLE